MRRLTFAAFAALGAFALSAAGCNAQSSDDKAFGERVRAYLLAHPEVIQEAVDKLQAEQDQQKAAEASATISKHRQALEHDPRDGVAGDPNGKITVVEFFDYRCPFCKAAEPDLEKLVAKHKDVRLVLKEFPILDVEDQTHISEDAARAALGALPQGRYLRVHDALFAQHKLDEAGVQEVLRANGVNPAADKTVAASKAVSDHLAENHKLATDIGVEGTPAFVVGDKLIAGAQMDELEAAIDAAGKTKPTG